VAGELCADRREGTRSIAEAAAGGPAALKLSDDMLGLAWGKLLINLNNAVNALSGKTLKDELRHRDYRRVFAAAMREGLELLERAQIEPATVGPISPQVLPRIVDSPDWLFNSVFLKRWKIDAKARSTMADDIAAGRRTEVDYHNCELVTLAERLQRDAPVNRAIVELVHKAEAGAPPLAPAALRKAALG
jgi:2-dehydropantoate 2-reductase